jgi:hypothetical protein
MEKNEIYLLSLSAFLFSSSYFFFYRAERKRKSLKFSLVRAHTLLVALLPIYLLSTVHRPMKFQNCRVKRAEKTTATTIEGEKKMREKGKKERPIRWTMMMLMVLVVAERTNSDARLTERVNWWMVKGLCRVRETKERKLHFHLFLSFVHIEKENRTSTNHCRWKVIKSEKKKSSRFLFFSQLIITNRSPVIHLSNKNCNLSSALLFLFHYILCKVLIECERMCWCNQSFN